MTAFAYVVNLALPRPEGTDRQVALASAYKAVVVAVRVFSSGHFVEAFICFGERCQTPIWEASGTDPSSHNEAMFTKISQLGLKVSDHLFNVIEAVHLPGWPGARLIGDC